MKFFNRGENLTLKKIWTAGDLEPSSRVGVTGWKTTKRKHPRWGRMDSDLTNPTGFLLRVAG